MLDATADRALLNVRKDPVLVISVDTMTIIEQNAAAKDYFSHTDLFTSESILENDEIRNLLTAANDSLLPQSKIISLSDNQTLVVCTAPLLHTEKNIVLLSVTENRNSNPPKGISASTMRLLESTYFAVIQVSIPSMETDVICAQHAMLSAHANFKTLQDLLAICGEYYVHPTDKEEFLATFTKENILNFVKEQPVVEVSVLRQHDSLYSWAKFSLFYVDESTVLFLGKDINNERLELERTEQYQRDLKTLALRNRYIVSSVSDIFRLMFHIDLVTRKAVICALHPSLSKLFSYDKIYDFADISNQLLNLVHPDHVEMLRGFSDLSRYQHPIPENGNRITLEYLRISPKKGLESKPTAKWTRSVIILSNPDQNGIPTEAVYAVQDVHEQKLKELEAQQRQNSLLSQFYTLLKHRFVWFIECDYSSQMLYCWRVVDDVVQEIEPCHCSRIFEKLLIPYCHPDDIKKVAKLILPDAVQRAFLNGQKEVFCEYRHKTSEGWKWVRLEMYISVDGSGKLRSMSYAADIEHEKQRRDAVIKAEHQQLIIRRKFGLSVQDSYIQIAEIDLDADKIYHYKIQDNDYVLIEGSKPFSQLAIEFTNENVYPGHRQAFETVFSYPQLLRAARDNISKIQHQFLYDANASRNYIWVNLVAKFFRDENGKPFLMTYIEDINDKVREHNDNLRKIELARNKLQDTLRIAEQARIRRTHIFSNMLSDVKLSFNQIVGVFDKLHGMTPQTEHTQKEFSALSNSFELVQKMIDSSRDLLLLENNQLVLLSELTSLPKLLQKLKAQTAETLARKQLKLFAYTSHVMNENIYCDSSRLIQLLESVFYQLVHSVPDQTRILFSVSQSKHLPEKQIGMYEFSITTFGNQETENQQGNLCEPLKTPKNANPIERSMFADSSQPNMVMHINKKLIALMNGSLTFERKPDHVSIATVRIPFRFASKNGECIFPQVHFYGKHAMIYDKVQTSGNAISEMLAEAGMQSDWESDFDALKILLKDAIDRNEAYRILFIRQSALNSESGSCLTDLQQIVQNHTKILVLCDTPKLPHTEPDPEYPAPFYVESPMFRSILSKHLWAIYEESKNS